MMLTLFVIRSISNKQYFDRSSVVWMEKEEGIDADVCIGSLYRSVSLHALLSSCRQIKDLESAGTLIVFLMINGLRFDDED